MVCEISKDKHRLLGDDVFAKTKIASPTAQSIVYVLQVLEINRMNEFQYELSVISTRGAVSR